MQEPHLGVSNEKSTALRHVARMQKVLSTSEIIAPLSRVFLRLLIVLAVAGAIASGSSPLLAKEAEWIWSPEHPRGEAPPGDCFFRKTFQAARIEQASITITSDDRY